MSATEPEPEPVWENDLINFRCYWAHSGWVSEGRRRGMDSPNQQMKQLYKLMAEAVPDDGRLVEVVITVRPAEAEMNAETVSAATEFRYRRGDE